MTIVHLLLICFHFLIYNKYFQANQKMSKTVLLKDLYAEIERLREGLIRRTCIIWIACVCIGTTTF